jgi:hypothetical protein
MRHFSIPVVVSIMILSILMASNGFSADTVAGDAAENIELQVYKSPTCGCCSVWIDHLEQSGFITETHHPRDLNGLKTRFGIPNRYQSCHTAVSNDGYIFEGHIPAKVIRRLLAEKPADVIGLSVPGMPVGSPGMEVDDKFMPYQVLLLNKDGSTEVYAEFSTAADQF